MAAETMSPPPAAPPREAAEMGSFYVGDLDPEVSDFELAEAFGAYGVVASLRVCKDSQSGKSLGYAYVNFTDRLHASQAMACLNHTKLRRKCMRIMWSERNPLSRKTGLGNLYVKNLHQSVNSNNLQILFSKFGTVLSCKVAEENGTSKGFGYVQFDCQESAMAALNHLHHSVFQGNKLHVCQFIKKSERTTPPSEQKFTSLYVKNLTKDMTESLLRDKFAEYGEITSATIMKDPEGKSRGFGFVNFKSPEEAVAAMEALNGTQLGSKILFVGRAQNKAEREEFLKSQFKDKFKDKFNLDRMKSKDSNLYVKNLDASIDDDKLHEYFSTCGQITSAKVMCHGSGISKGFGFVCFSTPEEAQKAIDGLNGTVLQGQHLYVARAQHKEDRCTALQKNLPPYPTSCPPSQFGVNGPLFYPSYDLQQQPTVYPSGANMSARYPLAAKYYQANYSYYFSQNSIKGPNYRNSGAGSQGRPHSAGKLPGNSRKNNCKALYPPLVKQHQMARILLEMNSSEMKKLNNSPNSQVAKHAQLLKESNTGAFPKFARSFKYY